jgi:hypothetical protein
MRKRKADQKTRKRSSRAVIDKAKRILKRVGRGKPPVAGDEIE